MSFDSRSPSVSLGEMVAAAFDQAATVTSDSQEAARIAARTVARWLSRAGRDDLAAALCGRKPHLVDAPGRTSGRTTPHTPHAHAA